MKPAVRRLLFGRRGSNHAVLSLFSRREQGVWYDPSDLASLSQDSTGATRVAAFGDPVGCMRDKSGNGNDATQATAGNRPTVDATGLVCAAAKTMATPAFLNSTFTNALTIFAVVTAGTPHTDNRIIFGSGAIPNIWYGVNGATMAVDFTTQGMTGVPAASAMTNGGILAIKLGSARASNSIGRWWGQNSGNPQGSSASVYTKTSGVSGGIAFTGTALTIGGLTSASFLWPGSVGEFIAVNRDVTDEEYKRVIDYLTKKWAPYPKKLLVLAGNSLTSGQGSTGGATQLLSASGTNYPSRVLSALSATWDIRTDAYPGRSLSQMIAESPTFSDMMTVNTGVRKAMVAWEVTNTLASTQSAATTLAQLEQYCAARKSAGFSVLVGTCIARGGSLYAGFEADRLAVNASILANFANYADGVVDFAAKTELSNTANATYFNADQIHLTDAGYQVAATAVTDKLTTLGW